MPEAPAPRLSATGEAWLRALDEACDAIAREIAPMSSAERRRPVGAGAGGDVTVRVDALAEAALLAAIEPLVAKGGGALLIAEEGGHRQLEGDAVGTTVVVDPIDGSLNAKRTLPIFSTAVAVADGPTMGDVWFGYVRDHGSGATHVAERGRGAWRDGRPLAVRPEAPTLVVAFEGASPTRLAAACPPLEGQVHRVRALGSLALSLCAVATGACDGMAGLSQARSVDTAGAQLICREAGALVGMPDLDDLASVSLDLNARHPVLAGNNSGALDLMRLSRDAALEVAAAAS